MKLWLISSDNSDYLLVAHSWTNLVEKLNNLFNKPVEINTKTLEFSINHEIVGSFKRITENDLENILWHGVELLYPESPVFGTKCN